MGVLGEGKEVRDGAIAAVRRHVLLQVCPDEGVDRCPVLEGPNARPAQDFFIECDGQVRHDQMLHGIRATRISCLFFWHVLP